MTTYVAQPGNAQSLADIFAVAKPGDRVVIPAGEYDHRTIPAPLTVTVPNPLILP